MTNDFEQSFPAGAAHAASEVDNDRPGEDRGMQMLGALLAVACGLIVGCAGIAIILAHITR